MSDFSRVVFLITFDTTCLKFFFDCTTFRSLYLKHAGLKKKKKQKNKMKTKEKN